MNILSTGSKKKLFVNWIFLLISIFFISNAVLLKNLEAKSIASNSVVFLQYHKVGEEHIRKKSSARIWTNIQEFQFVNHLNYLDGNSISTNVFKRDTYCNSIESEYLNDRQTQIEKQKNINYRKSKRLAYLAKKAKKNKKPGSAWKACKIKTDTQFYKNPNFAFSIISMKKAIFHLKHRREFKQNSVVVTVDDPYRSFYTYGFPKLKKRKLPFTFFINTDIVDKNNHKAVAKKKLGILTWNELREIAKYKGTTIACHTDNHKHMIEQSQEQNLLSVIKCMTRIKEELGVSPTIFAYPYGESTSSLRTMLAKLSPEYLQEAGNAYPLIHQFIVKTIAKHSANFFNDFKVEAAFGQHSAPAGFISRTVDIDKARLQSSSADLYNLPRFALNERYGAMSSFVDKVASLGAPIVDLEFKKLQEDSLFLQKSETQTFKTLKFSLLKGQIKYSHLTCYIWNKPTYLNTKSLHALSQVEESDKISFTMSINKIYNRSRRARINCSFAGKHNRFYWFGLQFTKYYRAENRNHKPALIPTHLAFNNKPRLRKLSSLKILYDYGFNKLSFGQKFHIQNPMR